jgi:hypothetical protein
LLPALVAVHARGAILERTAIIADDVRIKVTTERIYGLMVAAVLGTAVLAVAMQAAGKDVGLGVAIAALTAMVLSYARMAVLAVRAYGDEHAVKRVRTSAPRHMAVQLGGPLVVTAAGPWGVLSPVIGFGAMMFLQVIFMHWIVVAGMIVQRRARRTPPA